MPTFTKISELVDVDDTFQYIYDMGDEWRHEIKIFNMIDVSALAMIADEKAARKNHEKQCVFHGFLLFMR